MRTKIKITEINLGWECVGVKSDFVDGLVRISLYREKGTVPHVQMSTNWGLGCFKKKFLIGNQRGIEEI